MNIDNLTINTIRILSAEAIQKANSGHPGLPLGAAPCAYTLWSKHMKHNPENPDWTNRDRFVLSAGHGSILMYSLLHLFGYGTTVEDLKNFRQFNSLTPGHPEYGITKGLETTTGPLGQGIANAVGMAWAENYLANVFNKPGLNIVDHHTYALCGDGCLMEGVSAEAASLAGTLGLGKLILLYDSNNITIEGNTNVTFTEDVSKRFESYGWQVIKVMDGNNLDSLNNALSMAKSELNKPTIIEVKTMIGFGAPNKQGKASAHGEPLGDEEIVSMKKGFNWEYKEEFYVPDEVKVNMDNIRKRGKAFEVEWNSLYSEYKTKYPELATEFENWHNKDINYDFLDSEEFWKAEGNIATRVSSEIVLNRVCKKIPNIIGGSADLAPSTKTIMKDRDFFTKDNRTGSNLHFGIREFAMIAISNGMYLHGGLRPYIAGFFVFSDYMKAGLRLASLMEIPIINIMTHDSIGVGEDGPTHQPIEHLAALRSMPNHVVFRPCDTKETIAAWYVALKSKGSPTTLVLSRQNLTLLNETGKDAIKGAYVLKDSENPDILLIATGSEVELIYKAYDVLKDKGYSARVISMPSFELFENQSKEYKELVMPKSITKRLAVEAASTYGWHKYVGLEGDIIGIDTFGASAPAGLLFKEYGFTVENVVDKAIKIINS